MNSNQLQKLFGYDLYMQTVGQLLQENVTSAEVNFLQTALKLSRNDIFLDIPCGYGRTTLMLADMVQNITGVDNSSDFLAHAQQTHCNKVNVEFVLQDMRNLDLTTKYDAAACIFASFGNYARAQNVEILHNIATTIKPGGRLCIELVGPTVASDNFKSHNKYHLNQDDYIIDEISYNPANNRIETNRKCFISNSFHDIYISFDVWSRAEIEYYFKAVNLQIDALYSRVSLYDFVAYNGKSANIFIVATKL